MDYAKVKVPKLAQVFKRMPGSSGAGVWGSKAAAYAGSTTDCVSGLCMQKGMEDAKLCAALPDFETFRHLLKPAVHSGT